MGAPVMAPKIAECFHRSPNGRRRSNRTRSPAATTSAAPACLVCQARAENTEAKTRAFGEPFARYSSMPMSASVTSRMKIVSVIAQRAFSASGRESAQASGAQTRRKGESRRAHR